MNFTKKTETHDEKNNLLELDDSKIHFFKKVGLKDRFNFYEYIGTMIDG
jgi:hypothetical protein